MTIPLSATGSKKSRRKKTLKKVTHIKSRVNIKNKKLHKENIAKIMQNFARIFTRVKFPSRDIFCV